MKNGGRLVLLMEPARKRIAAPIPILIWEDQGIVGGPLPKGTGLRLEQRGTMTWLVQRCYNIIKFQRHCVNVEATAPLYQLCFNGLTFQCWHNVPLVQALHQRLFLQLCGNNTIATTLIQWTLINN